MLPVWILILPPSPKQQVLSVFYKLLLIYERVVHSAEASGTETQGDIAVP